RAPVREHRMIFEIMLKNTVLFQLFFLLLAGDGSSLAGEQTAVRLKQYQVPVLAMKPNNPVLQIRLIPQEEEPGIITAVRLKLDERTDAGNIRAVRIFCSEATEAFNTKFQFGTDQAAAPEMVF